MSNRLITPSQLSLFSRSPVIGAWWEEMHAIDPEQAPRPQAKALDELLFAAGLEHEKLLVQQLKDEGKTVKELPGKQTEADYAATEAAMREGFDYIWQASMRNGEMRGSADLLERIEHPSALGDWSYIPIECKLSSHPKPIYLVQACAYCELLTPLLGSRPQQFKLYLGGRQFQTYRSAEYWSWYEQLRERYRDFRVAFNPDRQPDDAPGDHGLWAPFIQQRLDGKRDLTLVAGMRQSQRSKLLSAGIHTIDALASWPDGDQVAGLDPAMLTRLRDQAQIQLASEQRSDGVPAFKVRPKTQQAKGLAMLPAPDTGDIWFDMEGFPDPVSGEKLEYLFGACYRDPAGEVVFKAWWAHTPEEEKQAFDGFVQWVNERRKQFPDLHVYHYASYEKTALGKLASGHQLHVALIDQWLREELLVDLYPIVRNGLLVGAPSYSIKKVERLYEKGAREEQVESAADSVVQYAQWKKERTQTILDDIEKYNEKDCLVTEGLHRFLLGLPELEAITYRANRWSTLDPNQVVEGNTSAFERDLEVAAKELRNELPDPIVQPDGLGPRGLSWGLQELVSQLIDFHEREGKVEWWEFFNRLQMTLEEREDDSEVISAATRIGVESIKQSRGYRYRFDADQPLKLSAKEGRTIKFALLPLVREQGRLHPLPAIEKDENKAVDIEGFLDEQKPDEVLLKVGNTKQADLKAGGLAGGDLPLDADLVPFPKQIYKNMLGSLVRIAQAWVFERKPMPPAFLHLLERRPIPTLEILNQRVRREPNSTVDQLSEFLNQADGVGLSLQGPPGTGKTTVTGQLIAQLTSKGQRVAVSSNTHEAINNVLLKVQNCLDDLASSAMVVKAASGTSEKSDCKTLAGTKVQALKDSNLSQLPAVLGGTIFTFVKEAYDEAPFDLLVIDEAGQVSLSNLMYLSRIARNILLVGDQQQLSQPNRAKHPGKSGLSCLDYAMADEPVVPKDRGVFLATSWRMPPALTQVVSELFYTGELQGAAANEDNRVEWNGQSQGLLFEAVEHHGNATMSDEEVDRIAAFVDQLHGQAFTRARLVRGEMIVKRGVIGSNDILITAPYNLQVNRLQKRLDQKARIGTVDKFQGQEAPVAIHSLTASDGDSAPRGLDFLLEANRLNVAISRAQCLSVVVGSPALATGLSNSVENVQRLNRLCRLMIVGQGVEG